MTRIDRSKAWWMKRIAGEPDGPVGAGAPGRHGRVFKIGGLTLTMVDDDDRPDNQVVRDLVEGLGGVFDEGLDWERVFPPVGAEPTDKREG